MSRMVKFTWSPEPLNVVKYPYDCTRYLDEKGISSWTNWMIALEMCPRKQYRGLKNLRDSLYGEPLSEEAVDLRVAMDAAVVEWGKGKRKLTSGSAFSSVGIHGGTLRIKAEDGHETIVSAPNDVFKLRMVAEILETRQPRCMNFKKRKR